MSSSDEEPKLPVSERVATFVKAFERAVAFALLVLLVIVVTLTTVELAALVFKDLSRAKNQLLDQDQMLELFGAFLLVLIGMELPPLRARA
jgi:Phosphate-starvation-inducible E family